MVPQERFELSPRYRDQVLSLTRMPIPPPRLLTILSYSKLKQGFFQFPVFNSENLLLIIANGIRYIGHTARYRVTEINFSNCFSFLVTDN